MSLLPIFLRLERRRCLVVGAGSVALQKIESLMSAGALITVVAPAANPVVKGLATRGAVAWRKRNFEAADLDGIFVVVAATNDSGVNHAVYEEALRRNVLCNAVDDPPNCDFYFGSVVTRGDLQVAISTAGKSPALAQRLRREIDAQLPAEVGPWLDQLSVLRQEVRAGMPAGEERTQLLRELAARPLCSAETCPARQMARERMQRNEEVSA